MPPPNRLYASWAAEPRSSTSRHSALATTGPCLRDTSLPRTRTRTQRETFPGPTLRRVRRTPDTHTAHRLHGTRSAPTTAFPGSPGRSQLSTMRSGPNPFPSSFATPARPRPCLVDRSAPAESAWLATASATPSAGRRPDRLPSATGHRLPVPGVPHRASSKQVPLAVHQPAIPAPRTTGMERTSVKAGHLPAMPSHPAPEPSPPAHSGSKEIFRMIRDADR